MSCSPFDLRDYFFGELPQADRRAVDNHVTGCEGCRNELEALRMTRTSLLAVRDEEPPRRIAFVSDKVFEPKWWQVWQSGPKAGFASAGLLALAILAHGAITASTAGRTQTPVVSAKPPVMDANMERAKLKREVLDELEPVLRRVVADAEARQATRLTLMSSELKQVEKNNRAESEMVTEQVGIMRRRYSFLDRAEVRPMPVGIGQ